MAGVSAFLIVLRQVAGADARRPPLVLGTQVPADYSNLAALQLCKASKLKGRVFIAKAVIILCQAKKCRDADHLVCFVHDADMLDAEKLAKALDEARKTPEAMPLPEFAYAVHTRKGRAGGKTTSRNSFSMSLKP